MWRRQCAPSTQWHNVRPHIHPLSFGSESYVRLRSRRRRGNWQCRPPNGSTANSLWHWQVSEASCTRTMTKAICVTPSLSWQSHARYTPCHTPKRYGVGGRCIPANTTICCKWFQIEHFDDGNDRQSHIVFGFSGANIQISYGWAQWMPTCDFVLVEFCVYVNENKCWPSAYLHLALSLSRHLSSHRMTLDSRCWYKFSPSHAISLCHIMWSSRTN